MNWVSNHYTVIVPHRTVREKNYIPRVSCILFETIINYLQSGELAPITQHTSFFDGIFYLLLQKTCVAFAFGALLEHYRAPRKTFLFFMVTYSFATPAGIIAGAVLERFSSLTHFDAQRVLMERILAVLGAVSSGAFLYLVSQHLMVTMTQDVSTKEDRSWGCSHIN